MKITNVMLGAMAAASTLAGFSAHSTPLIGGGWQLFYWENPNYPNTYGGPIYDYFSGDPTFTFTVTTNDRLNITDAFYNLDTFDLTINGVSQGSTGTPVDTDYAYIDGFAPGGFDAAFVSPYFSHATYDLGPGTYTLTGVTLFSPSAAGAGVGALELVPEPAGWALMLVGFGVVGALARRRTRLATVAA